MPELGTEFESSVTWFNYKTSSHSFLSCSNMLDRSLSSHFSYKNRYHKDAGTKPMKRAVKVEDEVGTSFVVLVLCLCLFVVIISHGFAFNILLLLKSLSFGDFNRVQRRDLESICFLFKKQSKTKDATHICERQVISSDYFIDFLSVLFKNKSIIS